MTVLADDIKSNNYKTRGNDSSKDEKTIKEFAKHMLKNSLFIATFQEKRYVEQLNSYKDVIKIDNGEHEFIDNLMAVKKRVDNSCIGKRWLGITEPQVIGAPAGYCLWVDLKQEIFGCYWFKVKMIEFKVDEICLKLDIVRPYKQEQSSMSNNTTSSSNSNNETRNSNNNNSSFEFNYDSIRDVPDTIMQTLSEVVTVPNIIEAIKFITIFVVASLTGLVKAIKYLMDYLLKFMDSSSKLVQAFTPIIIALFNAIVKIFGGLYLVIVSLFSPKSKVFTYVPPNDSFNPNFYMNRRALPPINRPRSSVRITPLD